MELIGATRAIVIAGLALPISLPLGGCADLDNQVRQLSNTVSGQVTDLSARLTAPPVVPHHTAAGRTTHPQAANPSAPEPPTAPEPTAIATRSFAHITVDGLSDSAVRALLGDPAARTPAAPGETWIYRAGSCELRLFLFPDVAKGGLHVLDHRVSDPAPAGADPQACLRRLHDDHTG
jgi:hypothetical protein